jgi:hypothetical protein
MARYSPLDKAAAGAAGVQNMDKVVVVAELEHVFRGNHATSDGENCLASPNAKDTLSEGGLESENLQTYYFGSSTITVGKINEMVEKGYFPEDGAHTSRAETMPEPNNDELMVYEDFFATGLHMPPHPALANILEHF